ncbi:MAG: FAD-binding oxidoreductase, partial [Pyrinomonadaceae bacterium]
MMNKLIKDLTWIVGEKGVISEPDERLVYDCDGIPHYKFRPQLIVLPGSTTEVSAVVRLLAKNDLPFAPRGAGTGLSGGALTDSVSIALTRMRRLIDFDPLNRRAIVETGYINAHLSREGARYGLSYVPDPSSQSACTIGGNIAENSGGIHCLKYGTTVDHVLAIRAVLPDGEIVDLNGQAGGLDLLGLFIGSEGTFGIATEATLKLTPLPESVRTLLCDFTDVNDASQAVSSIIAHGILPAALEMMDKAIIHAIEASAYATGMPLDAEAVLLIELDGMDADLDDELKRAAELCRKHGARSVKRAANEKERKQLWAARKSAFGAVGRITPDVMIQDAVVPRSRLPEVLAQSYKIGAKYNLRVANVFHAGDGNLHPLICYDSRQVDEVVSVREASRELMNVCVEAGGSITGEHGVGLDKINYLPLIFSDADMTAMLRVRAAFNPSGLCNPGKIIPIARTCGETRTATRNPLLHRDQIKRDEIKERDEIDNTASLVKTLIDKAGDTPLPHH